MMLKSGNRPLNFRLIHPRNGFPTHTWVSLKRHFCIIDYTYIQQSYLAFKVCKVIFHDCISHFNKFIKWHAITTLITGWVSTKFMFQLGNIKIYILTLWNQLNLNNSNTKELRICSDLISVNLSKDWVLYLGTVINYI